MDALELICTRHSHLTGRLNEQALLRACAVVLAVSGLSTLAQAIVG